MWDLVLKFWNFIVSASSALSAVNLLFFMNEGCAKRLDNLSWP
jgi:hypothetical protein